MSQHLFQVPHKLWFLQTKQVKAIVIACNTASALALDVVKEETDIPVMGVIAPGAAAAVRVTRNQKIGVIGTEATIRSHMYSKVMEEMMPGVEVIGKSCPLFVPIVEEGFAKHHIAEEVIDYYLASMKESDIDTMILGCTHYPILLPKIQKFIPQGVKVVAQGEYVATSLKDYLHRHPEMDMKCTREGKCRFYTTEAEDKFIESASMFLNENITVQRITLE